MVLDLLFGRRRSSTPRVPITISTSTAISTSTSTAVPSPSSSSPLPAPPPSCAVLLGQHPSRVAAVVDLLDGSDVVQIVAAVSDLGDAVVLKAMVPPAEVFIVGAYFDMTMLHDMISSIPVPPSTLPPSSPSSPSTDSSVSPPSPPASVDFDSEGDPSISSPSVSVSIVKTAAARAAGPARGLQLVKVPEGMMMGEGGGPKVVAGYILGEVGRMRRGSERVVVV